MKEFVFTLLMVTSFTFANAQEVISASGQTNKAGNIELSWTLGETVIETHTVGEYILTQGFHQTKLIVTAIDNVSVPNLTVKVYPNPTTDFLVVQISETANQPVLALFDASGKLLRQSFVDRSETRIDMRNYSAGSYFLKLNKQNGQPIQQFKIVKSR